MNPARLRTESAARTRPVAHFTARDTWINDPNGLVYVDGVFHAFFQNNPHGTVWGNISWGHATSPDLVTWTEHEPAILFTEDELIYSGSVVVDAENTAGFAAPGQTALVAVYTSVRPAAPERPERQAQALAFSVDGGMTWTKYAGNPVLDIGSDCFRDPKVFRHGDRWVMVAVEADERRVVLHTSADLLHWDFASAFGPARAVGGVWECPDLFPLVVEGTGETKWVLIVSLNPGGIAGGSGTQYFVGDFDGTTFVPDRVTASADPVDDAWLDYGPDYYAAVSFSGVPDDLRLMLGWMNNWEYAQTTPTAPWRSSLSLARDISLTRTDGGYALRQRPVLPAERAGLGVVRAEVSTRSASRSVIRIGDAAAPAVTLVFDGASRRIRATRTDVGDGDFDAAFARDYEAPLPLGRDGVADVLIVRDSDSVEVFVDDGAVALTQLVFPTEPGDEIVVSGDARRL